MYQGYVWVIRCIILFTYMYAHGHNLGESRWRKCFFAAVSMERDIETLWSGGHSMTVRRFAAASTCILIFDLFFWSSLWAHYSCHKSSNEFGSSENVEHTRRSFYFYFPLHLFALQLISYISFQLNTTLFNFVFLVMP